MDRVSEAAKILNDGGVVIFPTDTAFGIGVRIDDENAVRKLFELRKRAENKPVPVLVSSVLMAKGYVKELPKNVEKLMEKYWPGGLTIILQANDNVSRLVSGGTGTVGLRMPDNKIVLSLIENVGVPILGPSANFAGEATPFTREEIDPELVNLVDYVLDGETKGRGMPSTVIDCTKTPWKIVREGAVKVEMKNEK